MSELIITQQHMTLAKEIAATLRDAMQPEDVMLTAVCVVAVVATWAVEPVAVVESAIATMAQISPKLRGPLVKAVLDALADHMEPGNVH